MDDEQRLSVDKLLWRGSPTITPVQRAGVGLVAVGFLFVGAMVAYIGVDAGSRFAVIPAVLCALAGVRIGMNAIRRGRTKSAHLR